MSSPLIEARPVGAVKAKQADIQPKVDAPSMQSVSCFGLTIWAEGYQKALEELTGLSEKPRSSTSKIVVTPNVDHIVRLGKQKAFANEYASADYLFPDGMPIVWSSYLFCNPMKGRVTGANLFVDICRYAAENSKKVFILGGKPDMEDMFITGLEKSFPSLDFELYAPSMQFDPFGNEAKEAIRRENAFQPDFTFVCLGMPKQEKWALANREHLHAATTLCVGAAMEFALGWKKRAPRWVQRLGFEWLWRLLSEPHRLWRRYLLTDMQFLFILARELLTRSRAPCQKPNQP